MAKFTRSLLPGWTSCTLETKSREFESNYCTVALLAGPFYIGKIKWNDEIHEGKLSWEYSKAFRILSEAVDKTNCSKVENLEQFEKETFEHRKKSDVTGQKGNLLPARPIWLTQKDMKKLDKKFVTKTELKEDVRKVNGHMDMAMKTLIEFIGDVRDEIITTLGKQIADINQTLNNHHYKLGNHETRIQHLESNVKTN